MSKASKTALFGALVLGVNLVWAQEKVWDAYAAQKNSTNGSTDWNEFKIAVAASNPEIADLNKIPVGQALYLPEKLADGLITYHYANGTSLNNNAATGECQMILPDADGGTIFFQRSVDPETSSIKSRYVEADASPAGCRANDNYWKKVA